VGKFEVDAPFIAGGRLELLENGNLGIGNTAPANPLSFASTLGKKISLYHDAGGGDYGFGVASLRTLVYGGNASADVALGYDNAGTFLEKFAFKQTGAIAVSGNTGAAGQVLQSNGSGAAATWVSPTSSSYNNVYSVSSTGYVDQTASAAAAEIPGMIVTVTPAGNAMAVISFNAVAIGLGCTSCGPSIAQLEVTVNSVPYHAATVGVVQGEWHTLSGTITLPWLPGTQTVSLKGYASSGTVRFGAAGMFASKLSVQVIPQ
jgi:hypothetical protein